MEKIARTSRGAGSAPRGQAAMRAPSRETVSKARTGAPAKAGFTKQYNKARSECRVTFRLPAEAAPGASGVALVGDFNGWDKDATRMKKLKDGDFTAQIKLKTGRDYRFRYLIDGVRWENDWHADRYEKNAYFGDDSVVVV